MAARKSHYHKLQKRLVTRHEEVKKKLWDKHAVPLTEVIHNAKQIAVGSVGGLMLLTASHLPTPAFPAVPSANEVGVDLDQSAFFLSDLGKVLPQEVRPLSSDEESKIGEILTQHYGVTAKAELEGKRLNRSYGYIGAEQHLARYPGDTMESHFANQEDAEKYWSSGMAPGLGAWGHFVEPGHTLDEKAVMREKYYIAVQTFLSPNFTSRVREYRDFYKFRKMLVVNPHNGKAVVAVIGDAGPATWTGKSLGGSPEVMKYLERVDGRAKGPVLYFFIDDPSDTIPLGPVEPKDAA